MDENRNLLRIRRGWNPQDIRTGDTGTAYYFYGRVAREGASNLGIGLENEKIRP